MMPKVSVRPAASRNISRPSCTPFSIWSSRYSIGSRFQTKRERVAALPFPVGPRAKIVVASLHRAFFSERIHRILYGRGDRLDRHHAAGILDRFLDVEILDREVVVAVLEAAAQRLEVGLLHLAADLVLVRRVALQRLGV